MSSHDVFLSPHFTGGRFEEHVLPLDVLKDLSVLEEFLVEVAKRCYLAEHPRRSRSPKGFTEAISLGLSAIDRGSVRAEISVSVPSGTLFSPLQHYFEMARDAIIDTIRTEGADDNPLVPKELLAYFNRFGRSLRAEEAIELSHSRSTVPVRFTREIRRQLILATSQTSVISDELVIRGKVPEYDQEKCTFELQLATGQRVRAPVEDQHKEAIMDAFREYGNNRKLSLQGIGVFDRMNRLQHIENVEHVSLLDPLDLDARSDEILALKDGWLDGKGIAPREEGVKWITNQIQNQLPDTIPYPYMYPTPEAGILLEWTIDRNEISLDVNIETRTGYWHELSLDTDDDLERQLALDNTEAWTWIRSRLEPSPE